MKSGINERFAEGVRLFNQRHFFEAHEIWEAEWRSVAGERRIFYQGMIQTAAALLHLDRGNYAGALAIYLKSRPKLEGFPAVWMGIELGVLRSDLAAHFGAARRWGSACGNSPLAPPPTIRWSLANH